MEFSIDDEIEALLDELAALRANNRITKATRKLISGWIQWAQDQLNAIEFREEAYRDLISELAVNELLLSRAVIDDLKKADRDPRKDVLDLVAEMIRKLGLEPSDIDMFVIPSPFEKGSLSVRHWPREKPESVMFLLSPIVDFEGPELRALFGHEVSHLDQDVDVYIRSVERTKKKTGEILADVLAFAMLGPAFASAVTQYALSTKGPEQASVEGPRHPSLSCRVYCLAELNEEIWNVNRVIELCRGIFDRFLERAAAITEVESFWVPHYLEKASDLCRKRTAILIDQGRLRDILDGLPEKTEDAKSIRLNRLLFSAA